ncbi:periplasmic heavy metal sensor [Caenimonas sedimenti]|uniref:Periplasmic heavy metal sensor n=1 Tax=Caenimonas sedimenti TaxID=2596921 RepID=A0A562ZVX5_9BURK|nr:Spy/CpxP family protein refolding chaperone [Caenimonas sedimenti]TWO72613.1 periplasmic heavy metal sensor [Caenimonas sedimenti]
MRTWIRRSVLAVFGATIALGGLAACGHHHDRHAWSKATPEERAKMREKMVDRVAGKLDLNAEQKAKLGVLADRLQEQRATLMPAGTDPRAEVRSLVAGDKFDRAKAQAFVSQKTEAVQSKSPQVVAALGDFYDSLNPQQQAKVREFMDRRRGWGRS